ncbi:MAG: dihydroorotate dehydrogenase [Acidisphaera sp.]|nr:dihydroorotate dehydrogenase [Acidisphaera sp.]
MSPRLATSVGDFALLNPIICGSGEPVLTESGIRAALSAGAAGVIAKSVNERPEAAAQLDRADYTRADSQGRAVAWDRPGSSLFCRSGLQQRAVEDWFAAIARIDREVAAEQRFVAASLVLGSHEGAVQIATIACKAGLRVFELNIGAPHASEAKPGAIVLETEPARVQALVAAVRLATEGMQLWVKLTGLSTNLPALAVAAKQGGADAVVMMGRFMGMIPDIDTFAPVLGTSGAYSGPWALPIVCRFLALSRRAVGKDFALLGTNGVRDGADVARMGLAGASAVEALSAVMLEGFSALTRICDELGALLEARDVTFAELIGRAADRLEGYGEQPVNPGRWQDFVPVATRRELANVP